MGEPQLASVIERGDSTWSTSLRQQLERLPTNAARIDTVNDKLKYLVMFREDILEQAAVDIDGISAGLAALDLTLPDGEFINQLIIILDQSVNHIRQSYPVLWERIQRRGFVMEGQFTSLDDEDFISYGISEHGWAHIHVSPGHTLGEQKLPLMAKGLLQLIEQLKQRSDVQGITATSPLVASKTYGGLLEQIGFKLEGEIDQPLRQERFRTVPLDTPIHSASLPKEKYEDAVRHLETLARVVV